MPILTCAEFAYLAGHTRSHRSVWVSEVTGRGCAYPPRFPVHVKVTPMVACFSISSSACPKENMQSTKNVYAVWHKGGRRDSAVSPSLIPPTFEVTACTGSCPARPVCISRDVRALATRRRSLESREKEFASHKQH